MKARLCCASHRGAALVATLLWLTACGSDPKSSVGPSGAQAPGTGGDVDMDEDPASQSPQQQDVPPDTTPPGPAEMAECSETRPCAEGVCVAGACCPSVERSCSTECCGAGQVCLFDQCVTPGVACQTPEDCADDEYCETGLVQEGPGEVPEGPLCSQPVAAQGRCVASPALCADGEPAGTNGCIEACEFVPEVGDLSGVVEWQWGLEQVPSESPDRIDVWSSPVVGRVVDSTCDGKIDSSDPPNVVFVSGNSNSTFCVAANACKKGVLRVLDGRSGRELISLDEAEEGAPGMAGITPALGDMTGDGRMEIVAMTGSGKPVIIAGDGEVLALADLPVDTAGHKNFGWGGGLALGDMNNDGVAEIGYGRNVYGFDRATQTLTRLWVGTGGNGGTDGRELSYFVDLNADGALELLLGNTALQYDGTPLWNRNGEGVPNGFNATADFDGDGLPEVVVQGGGKLHLLRGDNGNTIIAGWDVPSDGQGGPPTVADFDGDGAIEIGVAMKQFYVMVEVDMTPGSEAFDEGWRTENHDLSSSVTGSSVFDFEADGKAEVVYNDECFLWVYDGSNGAVRMAIPTTSFTATESSIVADVDGDGHAEMLMVANGADPSQNGWKCAVEPWISPDPENNRPAWEPPPGEVAHRGLWMIGDRENSWVGTRTLWNQHAYSVTNVCDSRDSACQGDNAYGTIPAEQQPNWTLGWLNNFRQNVQEDGVFDAPDATLRLDVSCGTPPVLNVQLRNQGQSGLPAGVEIGLYRADGGGEVELGRITSSDALLAGQTERLAFEVPDGMGSWADDYVARILIDPQNRTFQECREDNNEAAGVVAVCAPQ